MNPMSVQIFLESNSGTQIMKNASTGKENELAVYEDDKTFRVLFIKKRYLIILCHNTYIFYHH